MAFCLFLSGFPEITYFVAPVGHTLCTYRLFLGRSFLALQTGNISIIANSIDYSLNMISIIRITLPARTVSIMNGNPTLKNWLKVIL